MIDLSGKWYPQENSTQASARLKLGDEHFYFQAEGQNEAQGPISELDISPRIGNIPRQITFADGSVFTCNANNDIDKWLSTTKHLANKHAWLHKFESRLPWVIVAVFVVVTFSTAFIWKGLPWISTSIADSLPVAVYQKLGTGTLESFDKWLFSETEISEEKQMILKKRFGELAALANVDEYQFDIHFRNMGEVPNAFALPSGDVVITDALIRLAEHDEEIESVLLHEIGHVVERHGLQQIIHSSSLSIIATLVLGDVTAITNIAIALPTFLIESSYSRQHELEADNFALKQMQQARIDPVHFVNIMRKFKQYESPEKSERDSNQTNDSEDTPIYHYLSSHPATEARILNAESFAKSN